MKKETKKDEPGKGEAKYDRAKAGAGRALRHPFLSSPFLPAILIFILSFLLYSNTLSNKFVWDDRYLIVENPRISMMDAHTLRSLVFENFWQYKDRLGGYYRPLVALSYHIDYKLFGLHPSGYHLTNILANAFVCVLVFFFIFLAFNDVLLALMAALIFSALPLHTENVAWIAGRTDIFASFWMLLSLIFFILAKEKKRIGFMLISLLCFSLALLSKEIAVILPFLILVLERLTRRTGRSEAGNAGAGTGSRAWPFSLFLVLFFIVLVAYLLLRTSVIDTLTSTYAYSFAGPLDRIALAFSILAGYCLKLLYPFRLNAEYDAPMPSGFLHSHVIAGILLLALLLYGTYRLRRNGIYVFGAAVLLLGLAPVLNLIPLGEISAERFLYFPSMGFALALGAIFSDAYKKRTVPARSAANPAQQSAKKQRRSINPETKSSKNKARRHKTAEKFIGHSGGTIVILVFLSILIAYSLRTFSRNMDWKDESVLFAKSVAAAPENPRAHINMGRALREEGKIQESIAEYKKALAIRPDYVGAMSGLAGVYQSLGKADEAAQLLQKALQISPNDDELHNNLGVIFMAQEKYSEAKSEFQETIHYNPNNMRGYFNLGLACFMLKEDDKALQYFEWAKKSGDAFAAAYYYIGLISAGKGRHEYARRCLEHFLSIHHSKDLERERAEAALKELKKVSRIPPQ